MKRRRGRVRRAVLWLTAVSLVSVLAGASAGPTGETAAEGTAVAGTGSAAPVRQLPPAIMTLPLGTADRISVGVAGGIPGGLLRVGHADLFGMVIGAGLAVRYVRYRWLFLRW